MPNTTAPAPIAIADIELFVIDIIARANIAPKLVAIQ